MNEQGSILEVLRGKESIKIEASLNALSTLYIGITILVAVTLGVIIAKKVS